MVTRRKAMGMFLSGSNSFRLLVTTNCRLPRHACGSQQCDYRFSRLMQSAVLLLLGNLSMYQRLNLLEQGQEHKPSETVGWFGTKDLTR